MISYLLDTSCLVAAVCAWHRHHDATRREIERRDTAGEKLVLAAHSLAEVELRQGNEARALLGRSRTRRAG